MYSLAVRNKIMPHQTDQPHPTKQKISVNAWATPTMMLMTKDPKRARAESCSENLGTPMHKQNKPEKIVPEIDGDRIEDKWSVLKCTDEQRVSLTSAGKQTIPNQTKPRQSNWKNWQCRFHQRRSFDECFIQTRPRILRWNSWGNALLLAVHACAATLCIRFLAAAQQFAAHSCTQTSVITKKKKCKTNRSREENKKSFFLFNHEIGNGILQNTYAFGGSPVRCSALASAHAISAFGFLRHGQHLQHPCCASTSKSARSSMRGVRLQQNTRRKHIPHLPRSFSTVSVADCTAAVAACSICSISFSTIFLLRRQQFQHDFFVSSTIESLRAIAASTILLLAAISTPFIFFPLFLYNWLNRRQGKHRRNAKHGVQHLHTLQHVTGSSASS